VESELANTISDSKMAIGPDAIGHAIQYAVEQPGPLATQV